MTLSVRVARAAIMILALANPIAADITLQTTDGLTVTFDSQDGSVSAANANGTALPLIPGAPGALAVRIAQQVPPSQVCALDFDTDGGPWTSAKNSNWESAGPYVTWQPDGGINDTGHLLLGDGVTTGVGMALAAPLPVQGGSNVRISWQARAASIETLQILCARVYDASGADITTSASTPPGWGWTSTSQAHAIWGLACAEPDVWELFERDYVVPPEAAFIRVSLRHWTGGDHLVHIDDLALNVIGGIQWANHVPVLGPITPITGGFRQTVDLAGHDLRLTADTVAEAGVIRVEVEAEDLTGGTYDRPLQLSWSLPVDATGWQWWDDIDTERPVDPNTPLTNAFELAGHAVSLYPFSSITSAGAGLALCVPMDETVAQRFEYDPARGLQSTWDLALSPATTKLGAGRAAVSLMLYQHDPEWGFRAAAQAYHDRFPEYFTKRTTREGAWMYPVPPSEIPDPTDFGFAFYEARPLDADERDLCAQLDIGIFHYIEPWLAWQRWGSDPNKPPYEERVSLIEDWAAFVSMLVRWQPDGGIGDSGHLLLGDGLTAGAGMATATPFPVAAGDVLGISWQARVANVETLQILGVRVFDAAGQDITQSTSAPSGWFWSGTSGAHVVSGIACSAADQWEPLTHVYPLPPDAAEARVSVRYWNGGDAYVRLDNLLVEGLGTAAIYVSLPFDVDDGNWSSAHNDTWDDADPAWMRAPRQQTAQAVINSSPYNASGRYMIDDSSYFWHEWSPGTWNVAWPMCPDPDHTPPSAYQLYYDYWVQYRLDEADGVYIDSVLATGGVGGWENHRAEHLATSDYPLTYSLATGTAVQLAPQANAEFLTPIAAEIRGQGKLMMINLFAEAMRFQSPHADVMGAEVWQLVEPDEWSRLRRTLAKQRIVSNLLQWGWDSPEYATFEQMQQFIRGQMFWGFYPAVSSAGGMLDGGTPDRYFHHPELYERDRPLFQLYIPVIRELSTAGWEPVTYATTSPPADIERFGDFSRGPVLLTVRSSDGNALSADITLDLVGCGVDSEYVNINAADVLSGQSLEVTYLNNPPRASIAVTLAIGEVGVYELTATPFLPGDFDNSGHINAADFSSFALCQQGPEVTYDPAHYCHAGDADHDNDVDMRDFRALQRMYEDAE